MIAVEHHLRSREQAERVSRCDEDSWLGKWKKVLNRFLGSGTWLGIGSIIAIISLTFTVYTYCHHSSGSRTERINGFSQAHTVAAACADRLQAVSYLLVFCDNSQRYKWIDYEHSNQAYTNSNGTGYTISSINDGDIETAAPSDAPSPFATETKHSAGLSVIADTLDGLDGEYGLLCQGGPGAGFNAKAYIFAIRGERAVIEKLEDGKSFKIADLAALRAT